MKVSQSTRYAIHALLCLAENQDNANPVSCSRLAELGNMPERFLLQILRDLTKQRILYSTRGSGGGFTLARPMEEISLLELIEAIDGPMAVDFPTKTELSPSVTSRLQKTLEQVVQYSRHELHKIRLSDLLD